MKKFITLLSVFILGGIVFMMVSGLISQGRSDELISVQDYVRGQPPAIQAYQASLIAVPAIEGTDFTIAAERTVDAVVHIRSQFLRRSSTYDDFFGALREYFGHSPSQQQKYPVTAWGSGVIIASDGYIVTNNHVVQDAEVVEVTLNDKRTFTAEIIGTDASTDLALIKIDAGDLPYVVYGNSDEVKIGEWVLAVGNPFNLTSTVTAGIVSAKARNINILGNQSSIESFIQFDAAVNRGNSGGALVNTEGELIGINAAIASNTGSFTGYSFAIPVNIVRKVVDDLLNFGEVQRAYLGVIIREIDSELAEDKNLKDLKGVYIDDLTENGGAMAAGIDEGDVITHIDNIEVNSMSQLLEVLGQHRPGERVEVDVRRNNQVHSFNIVLKNKDGTTSVIKREELFASEVLGASLQRITNEDKQAYGISNGLKVSFVDEDGILRSGGIRKGFIITNVNDQAVSSKDNLNDAIKNNNRYIKIKGIYPNGMKVTYEFNL